MNIQRISFYTSLSKRLLASLLTVGMAFHLSGCAMGGSEDEGYASGDETFAEESSGDFAEGEFVEGETTDGALAEGEEAVPTEGDEFANEVADAGQETAPVEGDEFATNDLQLDDLALEDEAPTGDVAAVAPEDDLSLDDEAGLPADIATNDLSAEPPPVFEEAPVEEPPTEMAPTDAPVFAEQPEYEAPAESFAAAPEPTSWVPVKKIKSSAFMVGSANLNRVYLARPGDTRPSISQKIFGDKTRSKDLLKWNSYLGRGIKTGDKVYYQSPSNPTDPNMSTYYEDVGIPVQNYVSRDGDNIREVSKTLLGDKDSWKEIWATNFDIESKGDIQAGLNIRYWPEGGTPAPVLAQYSDIPPVDSTGMTDPLAQQDPVMPEQDPLANTGTVPNDLVDEQALAQQDPLALPTATPASVPPAVATTEPPPPPPPAFEPPPPPPVEQTPLQVRASAEGVQGTEEADNMMMMGLAGIVLLAAGAVFFLMRRSRSRKVDLTQTTQVG